MKTNRFILSATALLFSVAVGFAQNANQPQLATGASVKLNTTKPDQKPATVAKPAPVPANSANTQVSNPKSNLHAKNAQRPAPQLAPAANKNGIVEQQKQ
jgi:hypothetical protein